MASMYTTLRGKNKKAKCAVRKDNQSKATHKLFLPEVGAHEEAPVPRAFGAGTTAGVGGGAAARERARLRQLVDAAAPTSDAPRAAACGNPACAGAAGGGGASLVCSRCRAARYCGAPCQRAHWAAHRGACGPTAEASADAVDADTSAAPAKHVNEARAAAAVAHPAAPLD